MVQCFGITHPKLSGLNVDPDAMTPLFIQGRAFGSLS